MSSKLIKKPADYFGPDYRIDPQAHPFGHLLDQPETRACCKDLRALEVSKESPGLWVALCRGCSAVHYRMRADAGEIVTIPSEKDILARYGQPTCCEFVHHRQRLRSEPDRLIEQCRICGKKHVRFTAEPGVFGLRR